MPNILPSNNNSVSNATVGSGKKSHLPNLANAFFGQIISLFYFFYIRLVIKIAVMKYFGPKIAILAIYLESFEKSQ